MAQLALGAHQGHGRSCQRPMSCGILVVFLWGNRICSQVDAGYVDSMPSMRCSLRGCGSLPMSATVAQFCRAVLCETISRLSRSRAYGYLWLAFWQGSLMCQKQQKKIRIHCEVLCCSVLSVVIVIDRSRPSKLLQGPHALKCRRRHNGRIPRF